jgi:hypothetical protein
MEIAEDFFGRREVRRVSRMRLPFDHVRMLSTKIDLDLRRLGLEGVDADVGDRRFGTDESLLTIESLFTMPRWRPAACFR